MNDTLIDAVASALMADWNAHSGAPLTMEEGMKSAARAAIAAIEANGHAIVPTRPTRDMLVAGDSGGWHRGSLATWTRMLAARPKVLP